MDIYIGLSFSLLLIIVVSWFGNKIFRKPKLWLGFMPVFSITHTLLGVYLLGLGFSYLGKADQIPLWINIVSPTFIAVNLFAIPLEVIGLSDSLTFPIAFGLNALVLSLIIVFFFQWFQRKNSSL